MLAVLSCSKGDDNSKPNLTGLAFVPTSSVPDASYYGGIWKLQSISTVSNNSNIIKDCQLSTYFYISSIQYGPVGVYKWVYEGCNIAIYNNIKFGGGGDYLSMEDRDNTTIHSSTYESSMTKSPIYLKLILVGDYYKTISNGQERTVTYPEAERKVFIYKNDSR